MAPGTTRRTGVITTWNRDRGFGFIRPDDGAADVFLHVRGVARGMDIPEAGSRVEYELETTPEGKTRARNTMPSGLSARDRRRATSPGPRASAFGFVAILAFLVLYLIVAAVWSPPYWAPAVYIGTSAAAFLVYGIDKAAAREGAWRTSESTLIVLGLIGGWPGAIVAQQLLRHKTRKVSFQTLFWVSVVVNVVVFVALSSPWFSRLIELG